ncbi:hypothetical protein VTG60DRAFT_1150 [Thermothelomyces hinnuleus]
MRSWYKEMQLVISAAFQPALDVGTLFISPSYVPSMRQCAACIFPTRCARSTCICIPYKRAQIWEPLHVTHSLFSKKEDMHLRGFRSVSCALLQVLVGQWDPVSSFMPQSIPPGPNKDVGLGGRGRGNIPLGYRSGKHLARSSALGSVQVLEVLVGGVLPRRRGHACSCCIVLPDGEVVRQDIEYSERHSFTDILTGKASTESEQVNVQLGITVGQSGYRRVAWHAWPQIGALQHSVLPCRAR